MNEIIDKNIDKLVELENKFSKIEDKIKEVKAVFDDEPLELEEINLEDLETVEKEPLFNFNEEIYNEIEDEDFGIKLKIKNKFVSQVISGLIHSGYKVSIKNKYLLIEEGEEKFG